MSSIVKRTILGVVGPGVTDSASIQAVQEVSQHFRIIDLAVDTSVRPGAIDKVKIDTGHWNMRTYTPVIKQVPSASLRLLVYLHGEAPGARWAGGVRPGDSVRIRGPKAALPRPDAACLLVGDETSLATAWNLQHIPGFAAVVEATDAAETQAVVQALGLAHITIVQRTQGGDHRQEMAARAEYHLRNQGIDRIIFTGHAQTIQQVGRALKAAGHGPRAVTKPHWADGKQGLD